MAMHCLTAVLFEDRGQVELWCWHTWHLYDNLGPPWPSGSKTSQDQCLKYPFPAGNDEKDQKRLKTLKERQERIQRVVHEDEKDWETGKVSWQ